MKEPTQERSAPHRLSLDGVRFALERWVLRGLRYRLLLAASIVVAVAVSSGLLLALVDDGSRNLGDSVWWAFLRLTDPGYLGDDEGLARRSISTVVTVLGYVLFLGLLIAILTQWLNESISKLESGLTRVALRDHVIILGWSQRTPSIVAELLETRGRAERFLAQHGAQELRIVILAEPVDSTRHRELRERLGDLWNDRQVFLRSGSPLRIDHLERVAFRDAAAIILPGADFGERKPETIDAQTVRTLMAVSEHAGESAEPRPLAVAELYDGRRARVARGAYAGDSEILAADDIVSRIIAQSVRQTGLCAVYNELLTLNHGCALFVRSVEGLVGKSFGELRGAFPKAIPLGRVRSGEAWPDLDPDPRTLIGPDDALVFVARAYRDCEPGPTTSQVPGAADAAVSPPDPGSRRVLVLGWSRKVPALLEEFERYGGDAFEIDVCSSTPLVEREASLARHGSGPARGRVRHVEAGFTAPGVLEGLRPQQYDNIVVLASEQLEESGQADATSVFACLMLRRLLPDEGPRPEIFVELLDEENEFLFRRKHEEVIVSPMLVSYLLSQVALRRELAAVIAELSRPWGAQLVLRSARDYLATDRPVRFGDLEQAAARSGEIALGFRFAVSGLALNPDRDAEWSLADGDEVVVLTKVAEPDEARG